jgi:hypothetical protein
MPTPPPPDVIIPIATIADDDRAEASRAAGELTQAGHGVEIAALEFDLAFDERERALRARSGLGASVRIVNPYRAHAGVPGPRTRRGAHRTGWRARLRSLVPGGAGDTAPEPGDDRWKATSAVAVAHLAPLPSVLRSRNVEDAVAEPSAQVDLWRDGTVARRARRRGDGVPYQRDYLGTDGRAYLVEWCDASGAPDGSVRFLDHESSTARLFGDRAAWEVTFLAERARPGAVVLAVSDWGEELLRRPALAGCATARLRRGSARAAVADASGVSS